MLQFYLKQTTISVPALIASYLSISEGELKLWLIWITVLLAMLSPEIVSDVFDFVPAKLGTSVFS